MHFFENHLKGVFPNNFGDLIYLKHLTIINDGLEHEGVVNPHRNHILAFHDA
jgi:hypothetical protein